MSTRTLPADADLTVGQTPTASSPQTEGKGPEMPTSPPSPEAMPPSEDPVQPDPSPIPLFPQPAEPTVESKNVDYERIELSARRIAAKYLDIAIEDVMVHGLKEVEWPSRLLGCGPSDPRAKQTPTPGYLVTVAVEGQIFAVHLDTRGHGMVCATARGRS